MPINTENLPKRF